MALHVVSPYLKSYSEIDHLENINGQPLNIVLKKIDCRSPNPETEFKNLLKKDWKKVQELGTNHQRLAELLTELLTSLGSPLHYKPVTKQFYGEWVSIVYVNEREDSSDPFRRFSDLRSGINIPRTWNDSATIHTQSGTLRISSGKIAMIRELGFYGHSDNRIEPEKIYEVVKGAFTYVVSPFFKCFSEIAALQSINGVPLNIINAELIAANYLESGTELKDILQRDWLLVKDLRTTHQKLAQLMSHFLASIGGPVHPKPVKTTFFGKEVTVTYYPSSIGSTDPFRFSPHFRSSLNIPEFWCDRAVIQTETFKLHVSSGRLAMIRELGFYGSGENRIDPKALYEFVKSKI